MQSVADLYSSGVKKKLSNYWAAWLPSTRFALGDVGILNGYIFEKRGSLRNFGIKFAATPGGNPNSLELVSGSGVTVALKAKGEVNQAFESVPRGKAGVKIQFGAEGAFVVQCPATFEQTFADLMAVQSAILAIFESGQWDTDWVVIMRLISAPSGIILISSSSSAQMEISADMNLTAGIADIGKSEAGLSFKTLKGEILKTDSRDLTPFFQLGTLKKRLFGGPKWGTHSMRDDEELSAASTKPHPKDDPGLLYFELVEDAPVSK